MNKVIPQILRNFELELVNPKAEWELHSKAFLFLVQKNINVKLRRRTIPGKAP